MRQSLASQGRPTQQPRSGCCLRSHVAPSRPAPWHSRLRSLAALSRLLLSGLCCRRSAAAPLPAAHRSTSAAHATSQGAFAEFSIGLAHSQAIALTITSNCLARAITGIVLVQKQARRECHGLAELLRDHGVMRGMERERERRSNREIERCAADKISQWNHSRVYQRAVTTSNVCQRQYQHDPVAVLMRVRHRELTAASMFIKCIIISTKLVYVRV